MHTTESAINAWIPAANAQMVFNGDHVFQTGWNTFNFNTPFAYNGVDNLLLIVLDDNDSYVSGNSWYTHASTTNCARYIYTDSAPYSISSVPTSTGTALSVNNNVIFGGNCDSTATCFAPNVYVTNITTTTADINWVPGYGESDWELEYTVYGDTNNWTPIASPAGGSITLDPLTSNTHYLVRMRSDCGGGDVSAWAFVDFRTECGQSTIPFAEDFNSYGSGNSAFPDCWSRHNTYSTTPYPYIASTTYLLPVNNFYRYTYSQQIYTADEITPTHTPTVITGIAFNYGYTSQNTDKTDVKIYLAHRSSSSFASTTDWTPISDAVLVYEGNLICSQGWNTFNFDTYFSYNGSDNLVLIVDDNSYAYNGSAYVFNAHTATSNASMYYYSDSSNPDPASPPTASSRTDTRSDVKFFLCNQTAPMSCPAPYLYVEETEAENVTLAWNPNGNENEWNLEYRVEGSNSWTSEGTVSTTPYTVSNLTSDVNYEFRLKAVCDAGDSSEWVYTSAYVPCESVELPIVDNFDSYNANENPSCWIMKYNGTTATPSVTTAQAYSGTKSLYFYCPSNGNYAYAISPRIDDGVEMDSLEIMFFAYTATAGYFIEVGIMEDPDDLSSFTSLGQFNPSSINNWELGSLISRGYAGEGHYVAFRVPQWFANNIYIDNVNIHNIPSCLNVVNIQATNITPYTADISWTANGSETQWNYVYGPAGTIDPDDATLMSANASTITLTDLAANTLYDIYVQANCGDGDLSIWMSTSFRTECAPMTLLPYEENFDSYAGTTSTATNVLPNCTIAGKW